MKNPKKEKCHVDLGPFCTNGKDIINMDTPYLEAYITFVELHIPTIRQDDENVRRIFNNQYFKARKKIPIEEEEEETEQDKLGIYLFLGIAIFAVLAMAIVLLIIYIRRRKSDDTALEDDTET